MANPFDPISPGDPYPFSAEARNAWNEMFRWWKTQRGGGPPLKQVMRQTGILEIKNNSGYDRERFDVLGIDDVFPDPVENLLSFKNVPALHGITPAATAHRGKFAILLKPAADGKIVHAVVAGVTVAKVDVVDASHEFAEVEDAEAGNLISGSVGSAKILWKESGTGVKWALIRMGNTENKPDWYFTVPSGVTVPKYGVVTFDRLGGRSFDFSEIDGVTSFVANWPDTTNAGRMGFLYSARFSFINLSGDITDNGVGACATGGRRAVWALYNLVNANYPSTGESWGMVPGSFELHAGLPGFIALGPRETDPRRALFVRSDREHVWWARATTDWWESTGASTPGNWYGTDTNVDQYVTANPITGDVSDLHVYDGTDLLPEIEIEILLSNSDSGRMPNVRMGNNIGYNIGPVFPKMGANAVATFMAVGDYTDDPVGTVKLWNETLARIPQGWRQVSDVSDKFLRAGDSVVSGTFGTTGIDYNYVRYILIERFE